MGVGAALSVLLFWVVRAVSSRGLPAVDDRIGLFTVLLVASAGFAVTVDFASKRIGRELPWTLPLGLSALMGLCGGLSPLVA